MQTGVFYSGAYDQALTFTSAARVQTSTLLIQNLSPHAATEGVWRILGNCVVPK